MFKNLIDGSFCVTTIKYLSRQYLYIEKCVSNVYAGSYTHICFKECFKIIKIYFKNSILGRMTEMETSQDTAILDNSKFFGYLCNVYRENMLKFKNYFSTSKSVSLIDSIHCAINSAPVKTVSFITTIAIIVNSILSIILKKDITLWAYVLRGLIFFVSVSSYNSEIEWQTIKENSIFIKFVAKR